MESNTERYSKKHPIEEPREGKEIGDTLKNERKIMSRIRCHNALNAKIEERKQTNSKKLIAIVEQNTNSNKQSCPIKTHKSQRNSNAISPIKLFNRIEYKPDEFIKKSENEKERKFKNFDDCYTERVLGC